jgi:glycosyltransferase involved in cell wall biosynthesis
MHICYLTPEYPHPELLPAAGIGSSLKNLVQGLLTQGLRITVVVYSQTKNVEFHADGVEIHSIAHKKYKLGGFYFYRKHLQLYINKLIIAKGIDMVEAPDWTGITAFMKLKVPVVIRMHGSDAYFCHIEGRKQKWKNHWFESLALKGADYLVSVSQFTDDETRKLFQLKKEITVIHNFINTAFIQPKGLPMIKNQLLYFGTIIRKKGVLELAHIFNEVVQQAPEATLLVVGKDVIDIQEKVSTKALFLSHLTEVAKKRVQILEHVPYPQMVEMIEQAHVVVLPSLAEAFPMAWLEAMALAKPMVTSNIGWAQEMVVDGESASMEHPSNHQSMADKIVHLINNPAAAENMGKAADKKLKQDFTALVLIKKNIEFYKQVLKQ